MKMFGSLDNWILGWFIKPKMFVFCACIKNYLFDQRKKSSCLYCCIKMLGSLDNWILGWFVKQKKPCPRIVWFLNPKMFVFCACIQNDLFDDSFNLTIDLIKVRKVFAFIVAWKCLDSWIIGSLDDFYDLKCLFFVHASKTINLIKVRKVFALIVA